MPCMEQYGNQSTYNIESVLHKNITGCEYYHKTCNKLQTWTEVVDEIYETVTDVEPWMSGNARGASTAFCLLYRSVRTPPPFLSFPLLDTLLILKAQPTLLFVPNRDTQLFASGHHSVRGALR